MSKIIQIIFCQNIKYLRAYLELQENMRPGNCFALYQRKSKWWFDKIRLHAYRKSMFLGAWVAVSRNDGKTTFTLFLGRQMSSIRKFDNEETFWESSFFLALLIFLRRSFSLIFYSFKVIDQQLDGTFQ